MPSVRIADDSSLHQAFCSAKTPHVLMITNHGIHQWEIIPGLPDTGGQNVFVNQFTDQIVRFGFRVTIVNRGGYNHPATKLPQTGLRYKSNQARILYLEDGQAAFVRKEDMGAQIPKLVEDLYSFLAAEVGADKKPAVDLIVSHYWDGAQIGVELNKLLAQPVKHVWVPHSLGTVKKNNMDSSQWANLRVDERIATERSLMPHLTGVAATSALIRTALETEYGAKAPLFLPPCVDPERYHPRALAADHEVWSFLSTASGLPVERIRSSKIVTEISRTDKTKRKDVLIKAFGAIAADVPDALLLVSIDNNNPSLAAELRGLIQQLGLSGRVCEVGSVWKVLPYLYAASSVYCTPSVMEGFGMSIQEAAATGVPAVSSDLVPFAVEYLLGDNPQADNAGGRLAHPVRRGKGGLVVKADDVEGFAFALRELLTNDQYRTQLGKGALAITVPYFTWESMVQSFLEQIEVERPR